MCIADGPRFVSEVEVRGWEGCIGTRGLRGRKRVRKPTRASKGGDLEPSNGKGRGQSERDLKGSGPKKDYPVRTISFQTTLQWKNLFKRGGEGVGDSTVERNVQFTTHHSLTIIVTETN